MREPDPKETEHTLADVAAAVRMHAELEQSFGAERVPFRPERVEELREKRRAARTPAAGVAAGPVLAGSAEKVAALEEIRRKLARQCCCDLGKTRTNLVFSDGTADADLMFIGEAPGYHEDAQGIPFVGPAGQLLTRIIEAIGLRRDQVYIANITKCRPPENRLPLPQEAAACMPYLRRQIEIVKPKIIVTLGNLSTQAILQTTLGITKTRGRWTKYNDDIEVMPTFHPSYLLRYPAAKKEVWDDMKKVHARMRELGLKIGDLKTSR
jgi:DNA polymerase